MKRIVFATSNRAKVEQMRFVAKQRGLLVEVVSVKELLGEYVPYEEIGATVGEIALSGARSWANKIDAPVITEDTDFRVDALNGDPGLAAGIFLKQFGRGEMLRRMQGVVNRRASIHSAVAYAAPDGTYKLFEHTLNGCIAQKEQFGNFPDWVAPTPDNPFGGGYNSIFIPDGWSVTLAEIPPEEAIPWSYRERNFTDVIEYILSLS